MVVVIQKLCHGRHIKWCRRRCCYCCCRCTTEPSYRALSSLTAGCNNNTPCCCQGCKHSGSGEWCGLRDARKMVSLGPLAKVLKLDCMDNLIVSRRMNAHSSLKPSAVHSCQYRPLKQTRVCRKRYQEQDVSSRLRSSHSLKRQSIAHHYQTESTTHHTNTEQPHSRRHHGIKGNDSGAIDWQ